MVEPIVETKISRIPSRIKIPKATLELMARFDLDQSKLKLQEMLDVVDNHFVKRPYTELTILVYYKEKGWKSK